MARRNRSGLLINSKPERVLSPHEELMLKKEAEEYKRLLAQGMPSDLDGALKWLRERREKEGGPLRTLAPARQANQRTLPEQRWQVSR